MGALLHQELEEKPSSNGFGVESSILSVREMEVSLQVSLTVMTSLAALSK